MERHFQEKIPFKTHSRTKLPHAAILKNFKVFLSKKTYLFSQKPKFWMFREFLLFQWHSTANLLQFGEKKISRSKTWTNMLLVWRQLANIEWKNVKISPFQRKILHPYFKKGAKQLDTRLPPGYFPPSNFVKFDRLKFLKTKFPFSTGVLSFPHETQCFVPEHLLLPSCLA